MNSMKKYLMNGMAALALIVAAGCSHDDGVSEYSKEEKLLNAAEKLAINAVDPNQDWNMTAKAAAAITVYGDYGDTYTISIYSNDPLMDGVGYVLTQGEIENGGTFESDFEYPSVETSLIVGITNHGGYTTYRAIPMVDGLLQATIGQPAEAESRSMRKSMQAPSVPHLTSIPNAAFVATYLEGAKEPTTANTNDNYDDTKYVEAKESEWVKTGEKFVVDIPGHNEDVVETKWVDAKEWGFGWSGTASTLNYNYANAASLGVSQADITWWDTYCAPFNNGNWAFYNGSTTKNDATFVLMDYLNSTGRSSWVNIWAVGERAGYKEVVTGQKWIPDQGHNEDVGYWTDPVVAHWEYDETFVKKFKIEAGKTWDDCINVATTEGLTNGVPNHNERSVVVRGTWNLNNYQRVGSLGVIIVDSGGVLNIPSGKTLEMVNQARLVVMPGGTITGQGTISVTNGNAEGFENYNGGSINVGAFSNNFGKFYNYNTFKANEYRTGGQESNFYNHGLAYIDHSSIYHNDNYTDLKSPNARIFNACQWYCKNDMTARNIEMTAGSYLYVGGELLMNTSEDGTGDPTYVAMAAGSLLRAGRLHNNSTAWVGPTSGYAVVELGKVKFLNWDGDGPLTSGYFSNNLAVSIDDKTNACMGKTAENAYQAFAKYVANGHGTNGNTTAVGNGGVVLVNKGKANVQIPASTDFKAGEKGCTPGYTGTPDNTVDERPAVWSYAFEDTPLGDYDMNDVVLKVSNYYDEETKKVNENKLDITLCCTGATLSLRAYLGETALFGGKEVHELLGQPAGKMLNTGLNDPIEEVHATIDKPSGFSFADADFWIDSPIVVGGVHIAKSGEDPHGIVVPADWQWPLEYVCIKDAYPNFVEFAKNAATTDDSVKGWYKQTSTNPVADKVYVKPE